MLQNDTDDTELAMMWFCSFLWLVLVDFLSCVKNVTFGVIFWPCLTCSFTVVLILHTFMVTIRTVVVSESVMCKCFFGFSIFSPSLLHSLRIKINDKSIPYILQHMARSDHRRHGIAVFRGYSKRTKDKLERGEEMTETDWRFLLLITEQQELR